MHDLSLDQLLTSRRSIRTYTSKAVPKENIQSMVASAMTAPSPSNSQPVRFLQIVSKEIRQKLKHEMEKGFQNLLKMAETKEKPKKIKNIINYYWRYSSFMLDAPALFAVGTVCQDRGFSHRLKQAGILEDSFKENDDYPVSTGFSLAFFALKAQQLGLGTCILTAPLVFVGKFDFLTKNKDININCFVTAGFADECPGPSNRLSIKDIYSCV